MIYLGRAGSLESHERYRRIVAEWLATGRPPVKQNSDRQWGATTVKDIVERYVRWARHYYVRSDGWPSSGLGPVESAAKALCGLYGSTDAAQFGPVALRAVRQVMLDSNLCRNVINQRIACVKRIFRWAVAKELVPPLVMTALAAVAALRWGRSGARETPPVRPVPDEHVAAVLQFLPPTLRAMVQLQRLTGMRSGELCILRTCDVDTSGEVWLYRPHSHKTDHHGFNRIVHIGPKGQNVLGSFLCPQTPEEYVFSPVRAQHERAAGRAKQKIGLATIEPIAPIHIVSHHNASTTRVVIAEHLHTQCKRRRRQDCYLVITTGTRTSCVIGTRHMFVRCTVLRRRAYSWGTGRSTRRWNTRRPTPSWLPQSRVTWASVYP